MSDETVKADFDACDSLLCEGSGRGEFISENIERMAIWKAAAESGDAAGQLLYGLCCFYGHGEQQDDETAIQWFLKSAEQGNAQAQCTLGICYQQGWGVECDVDIANDWFVKAAKQGHEGAIPFLTKKDRVEIGIDEKKVLTSAIANQFIKDESSVDLSEFNAIDDDAAGILGRFDGYDIYLLNIYAMSDFACEAILGFNGNVEFGITDLTDAMAHSIAKHNGSVSISEIKQITDSQAEILSSRNGDLSLEVESLSDDAAMALAKHTGGSLSLARLTDISPDAAAALSEHGNLHLSSFIDLTSEESFRLTVSHQETLSPESTDDISHLVRFKTLLTPNHTVDLNSLDEELISSNIDSLAELECQINLGQLEITDDLAAKLSQFKAAALDFRKCEPLSNEAVELLIKFNGSIKLKLCFQDEAAREILKSHHSLKTWGDLNGPYLDQVCKNCGNEERLELAEFDHSWEAYFGDGPWDLCWDCREELTDEQIALLEED